MEFTKQDMDTLKDYVDKTIQHGCRDCGFRYIFFSTHVTKEPDGTKVFFIDVECHECDTEYKEIMTMRNDND